MLAREEISRIINGLRSSGQEAKAIDELEAKERLAQSAASWGRRETSMINQRDLPLVNEMVRRLEEKYLPQLDAMGGTWAVLGAGSRFTLASSLPPSINDREPYTYLLVKDKANWTLYYIDGKRNAVKEELSSISGLVAAVAAFPANLTAEGISNAYESELQWGGVAFKYLRFSTPERNRYQTLSKVFISHHRSKPNWTLLGHLQTLIQEERQKSNPDQDKIWQLGVIVNLIASPTNNGSKQNYFYPNTNPTLISYGHHLPRLLALQLLATRDPGQVFRPHEQLRLDLIANSEERKKAKELRIAEFFAQDVLFTLYDIAREHSDDNPIGREDRNVHIPSCPQGAFGRTVFRLSALNAISALRSGTVQEVEQQAQAAAKARQVGYQEIPSLIEAFIFECLINNASVETQKAIYHFFTFYMQGIEEPTENAPDTDKKDYETFKKSMSLFKGFLKIIEKECKQELEAFLKRGIPGLVLTPEIKTAIHRIFSTILDNLNPENVVRKNYLDIYSVVEDRNLIDRLKNVGARCVLLEGVQQALQNEEIIHYRRKIQELSNLFSGARNLITNEVHRGLLACCTLGLTRTNGQRPPQNTTQLWQATRDKIKLKLAFCKNHLEEESIPRARILADQLKTALSKKTTNLPGSEQKEVIKPQLEALIEKGLGVCERAKEIIDSIDKDIASFNIISSELEKSIEGSSIDVNELQSVFNRFGFNLQATGSEKTWVHVIVRTLFLSTMTPNGKEKELNRIKSLRLACCPSDTALAKPLLDALASRFLAELQNKENAELGWEARKSAIHIITKIFPGLDLGYHAIVDFEDLVHTGESILDTNQLPPEQKRELFSEVFETAGQSLLMAELEAKGNDFVAKAGNLESYKTHFCEWKRVGTKLLGKSEAEPCAALEATDANLGKIYHFAVLTICRNLGLTDIRLKDKETIEKICRAYLVHLLKPEISIELFSLNKDTPFQARLSYLGYHLSCLITTLKPLATLYNTGHVRIMDSMTGMSIIKVSSRHNELFRTSASNPTSIVRVGYTGAQLWLMQGRIGIDKTSITNNFSPCHLEVTIGDNTPGVQLEPFNFYLLHQSMLQQYLPNTAPTLALVPIAAQRDLTALQSQTTNYSMSQISTIQRVYLGMEDKVSSTARHTDQMQARMYLTMGMGLSAQPPVLPVIPEAVHPLSPVAVPQQPLVSRVPLPQPPLVSPVAVPQPPLVSPVAVPQQPLVSRVPLPQPPLVSPVAVPQQPLVSRVPLPQPPLVSPVAVPQQPLVSRVPLPQPPLVSPVAVPQQPLVSRVPPPQPPLVSPVPLRQPPLVSRVSLPPQPLVPLVTTATARPPAPQQQAASPRNYEQHYKTEREQLKMTLFQKFLCCTLIFIPLVLWLRARAERKLPIQKVILPTELYKKIKQFRKEEKQKEIRALPRGQELEVIANKPRKQKKTSGSNTILFMDNNQRTRWESKVRQYNNSHGCCGALFRLWNKPLLSLAQINQSKKDSVTQVNSLS